MQEEEKSFIVQLREAGAEYLQAKLQLTKVQAFGKIARVTGIVFSMLIIALLACFTVLFVGLMLGFLIADLLSSNAIGFSVVGALFVILLTVLVLKRESLLEKPITEKIIQELFEDENDDAKTESSDSIIEHHAREGEADQP
ncbi:MAG TPA: hypothetical protein PLD84_08685 [Chitinophagales bacterium]|nr:hypothetical protein [Chitinophagales bacterium]